MLCLRPIGQLTLVFVLCLQVVAGAAHPLDGANYGQVRDFLAKHTKVLELVGDDHARAIVCPDLQGRVMTSTCDGAEGRSLGYVNFDFIEKKKEDRHFNNYGGEDRLWLGPEGGQFSLWFAPGAKQDLVNWLTPPGLNEGAFDASGGGSQYKLERHMQLRNASGTRFNLRIVRIAKLLPRGDFGRMFGLEAKRALDASRARYVGFQTVNFVVNLGPPLKRETGLVSIWSLGQFPPGQKTDVVVPYRAGSEAQLGPVVKSDYFGPVPPERLRVTPKAVYFRADGNYRSKIGISQRRALPVAGSLDREKGLLTLVSFSIPGPPDKLLYVNNAWDLPQKEPYVGDVVNSYNDGPPAPGKPALGGFYELETLSPAKELQTHEGLQHVHSTFHIQGDVKALIGIARLTLGVDVE